MRLKWPWQCGCDGLGTQLHQICRYRQNFSLDFLKQNCELKIFQFWKTLWSAPSWVPFYLAFTALGPAPHMVTEMPLASFKKTNQKKCVLSLCWENLDISYLSVVGLKSSSGGSGSVCKLQCSRYSAQCRCLRWVNKAGWDMIKGIRGKKKALARIYPVFHCCLLIKMKTPIKGALAIWHSGSVLIRLQFYWIITFASVCFDLFFVFFFSCLNVFWFSFADFLF